MITHLLAFVSGGYIIPAAIYFALTWEYESKFATDQPSTLDKLLTSTIAAATWPFAIHRVEPLD